MYSTKFNSMKATNKLWSNKDRQPEAKLIMNTQNHKRSTDCTAKTVYVWSYPFSQILSPIPTILNLTEPLIFMYRSCLPHLPLFPSTLYQHWRLRLQAQLRCACSRHLPPSHSLSRHPRTTHLAGQTHRRPHLASVTVVMLMAVVVKLVMLVWG